MFRSHMFPWVLNWVVVNQNGTGHFALTLIFGVSVLGHAVDFIRLGTIRLKCMICECGQFQCTHKPYASDGLCSKSTGIPMLLTRLSQCEQVAHYFKWSAKHIISDRVKGEGREGFNFCDRPTPPSDLWSMPVLTAMHYAISPSSKDPTTQRSTRPKCTLTCRNPSTWLFPP